MYIRIFRLYIPRNLYNRSGLNQFRKWRQLDLRDVYKGAGPEEREFIYVASDRKKVYIIEFSRTKYLLYIFIFSGLSSVQSGESAACLYTTVDDINIHHSSNLANGIGLGAGNNCRIRDRPISLSLAIYLCRRQVHNSNLQQLQPATRSAPGSGILRQGQQLGESRL